MTRVRLVGALAALLLSACAARPERPGLPPLAVPPAAHQAARERALAQHTAWGLSGRVALSNGRDGGSGRLDWWQEGERYVLELSAPVTRQSWRLHGDASGATLEGFDGGPRSGPDPVALLREATRWEIPVTALGAWVRGAPAAADRLGPPTLAFGRDGRLARLEQGGWTIEYDGWQAVAGAPELPARIEARRGEARVRLIVDAWRP